MLPALFFVPPPVAFSSWNCVLMIYERGDSGLRGIETLIFRYYVGVPAWCFIAGYLNMGNHNISEYDLVWK